MYLESAGSGWTQQQSFPCARLRIFSEEELDRGMRVIQPCYPVPGDETKPIHLPYGVYPVYQEQYPASGVWLYTGIVYSSVHAAYFRLGQCGDISRDDFCCTTDDRTWLPSTGFTPPQDLLRPEPIPPPPKRSLASRLMGWWRTAAQTVAETAAAVSEVPLPSYATLLPS